MYIYYILYTMYISWQNFKKIKQASSQICQYNLHKLLQYRLIVTW